MASGVYLYETHPEAQLFSSESLTFIVIGLVVAAALFNVSTYMLQQRISRTVFAIIESPYGRSDHVLGALSVGVLMLEASFIFLAAHWIFNLLHPLAEPDLGALGAWLDDTLHLIF